MQAPARRHGDNASCGQKVKVEDASRVCVCVCVCHPSLENHARLAKLQIPCGSRAAPFETETAQCITAKPRTCKYYTLLLRLMYKLIDKYTKVYVFNLAHSFHDSFLIAHTPQHERLRAELPEQSLSRARKRASHIKNVDLREALIGLCCTKLHQAGSSEQRACAQTCCVLSSIHVALSKSSWAVEGSDGVCPSLPNQRTATANTMPWDLKRHGHPSSEALLLLQVAARNEL